MAYKVAIDAGHGSNTAGKRTPDGYKEHYINVKCANYFNTAMKRCGIETVKIAWDDTNSKDDADVALSTRQKQIKNAKCNVSVSWHANAYGDGKSYNSAQGIETFVHSNILRVKDSKKLANKVQSHLIKGTTQKNRGVKTSNLAMCNCSAMGTKASILIEIGFMTNQYEANLMKTDAFCLECAEEAAQGVCEYLGVTYKKATTTSTRSYLMNGDSGVEVKTMQSNLIKIGYSCGSSGADGIFGSGTDIAVKRFQADYGLTVDGKYGSGSKTKMTEILNLMKNPTKKYLRDGVYYDAVFNPVYYANHYSDLKVAFGANATKLFNHFMEFGIYEGRIGISYFNPNEYKSNYADLRIAFGDDLPAYYKHYAEFGCKEGRSAV